MSGIFRRAYRFDIGDGTVTGEMADDFHHFALTMAHDGRRVTDIGGEGLRTPWNTCLKAPNALAALNGLALQDDPATFIRQSNSRMQCTHLYELAALAASHLVRGAASVTYEAAVPYPLGPEPLGATLTQNGEAVLDWHLVRPDAPGLPVEQLVRGDMIVAPAPFAGQRVSKLLGWAAENVDAAMFDAIYILRRAVGISAARVLDLDNPDVDIVDLMFRGKTSDCFAFQPENRDYTTRHVGSTLDFTAAPGTLLRETATPAIKD